jgi:hypothetical protein
MAFKVSELPRDDPDWSMNSELRAPLAAVLHAVHSSKKPSLKDLVACLMWVHRKGAVGQLRRTFENGEVPSELHEVSCP